MGVPKWKEVHTKRVANPAPSMSPAQPGTTLDCVATLSIRWTTGALAQCAVTEAVEAHADRHLYGKIGPIRTAQTRPSRCSGLVGGTKIHRHTILKAQATDGACHAAAQAMARACAVKVSLTQPSLPETSLPGSGSRRWRSVLGWNHRLTETVPLQSPAEQSVAGGRGCDPLRIQRPATPARQAVLCCTSARSDVTFQAGRG
jgi:hypothetical protein